MHYKKFRALLCFAVLWLADLFDILATGETAPHLKQTALIEAHKTQKCKIRLELIMLTQQKSDYAVNWPVELRRGDRRLPENGR